jgi:hypothetical protein
MTPRKTLSRGASTKMLSLRFGDDSEETKATEKVEEDDDIEDVELGQAAGGEDAEELRGFMFSMLKALLFDLVVGESVRRPPSLSARQLAVLSCLTV